MLLLYVEVYVYKISLTTTCSTFGHYLTPDLVEINGGSAIAVLTSRSSTRNVE